MRALTLSEKISIKGELNKQGVLPHMLAGLNMREAVRLYWVCFGKPVSEFGKPGSWRRRHASVQQTIKPRTGAAPLGTSLI